ncbi:MAG: T9SS type A sorting domain-containing protein [Ignavibacterium album]|uniref:T9SS type A sorting domain-containing protein n=1 Tax=Ignavibacterium album TaxID=591197 RepID=UPI0026EB6E85|nr:T9SS type A sorting domain-containing protein [Ignavibacterium album]MCX8106095.1 T9SS type A sorting domain-containing protein [Ignavibacterium album]
MKKIVLLILFISNLSLFAQWVNTNGPGAGNVRAIISNGTNLFAGTEGGGVYLSTDNGTNWTTVNSGLTNLNVTSFAVSGNNIFAGTFGGVFLSTNNGTNWVAVNNGLSNPVILSLAISGTNIFAGANGILGMSGLFLSTDNGSSWTVINNGLTDQVVRAIVINGSNIFIGTNGGVFLSTNNGTTWTAVNSGLTNTSIYALAISGNNLFAATNGGGVFKSTNNGSSWAAVNSGLNTFALHSSFAVSGSNVFAGTMGAGIFLTSNQGTNWNAVNDGFTTSFHVWSLYASDSYLFAGTGVVFRRPLSELITSIENNFDIPLEFNLSQNYPNPFNPSTKISWQSPVGGLTTLRIYDVLGNEVVTLVDEYKEVGNHEIILDSRQLTGGNSIASGVYFYKLQVGEFVQTRKMILTK